MINYTHKGLTVAVGPYIFYAAIKERGEKNKLVHKYFFKKPLDSRG